MTNDRMRGYDVIRGVLFPVGYSMKRGCAPLKKIFRVLPLEMVHSDALLY